MDWVKRFPHVSHPALTAPPSLVLFMSASLLLYVSDLSKMMQCTTKMTSALQRNHENQDHDCLLPLLPSACLSISVSDLSNDEAVHDRTGQGRHKLFFQQWSRSRWSRKCKWSWAWTQTQIQTQTQNELPNATETNLLLTGEQNWIHDYRDHLSRFD